MADDGVGQRLDEPCAHAVVAVDLRPRVGILLGHVGAVQVREDRGDLHGRKALQRLAQPVDLPLHEAEPVHAGIELDVDRIAGFAGVVHGLHEVVERPEAVNFGFEAVGDHQVEAVGIGVQHHDRHRDAAFAQQDALVGEGHGQIVDPLMLEHLRHLEIPGAVRPGLDHGHELRAEIQLRAEIIEVVDHGVEVDLQHRGVALVRKGVGQLLETVVAGALQQHGASGHGAAPDAGDALVGRGVEGLVAVEERAVAFQFGADADQGIDPGTRDHAGNPAVEFVVRKAALGDIRQHERAPARQGHAVEVVERQGQRIEIEVVGVVDEHRVVDPLLDFEPHGDLRGRRERRGRIAHRRAEGLDDLGVAARRLVADHRLGELRGRGRIEEFPSGETRGDQTPQRLVVAVVDDHPGTVGQDHLFETLLFEIEEILLMGVADRGEDRIGTDDAFEALHLARFRDPGLDQGQLLVALDHQHRQRHAQLRVVALGRAVALHAGGQLLGDPLLDDGLSVRAGDSDDRSLEPGAVIGRQTLQGRDGVPDEEIAAPGHRLDGTFDEEGPHAAGIHLRDEIVRVVVGAAHGDENRVTAQFTGERAAVGDDRPHVALLAREATADDGGDLRKFVVHDIPIVNGIGPSGAVCPDPGAAERTARSGCGDADSGPGVPEVQR